MKKKNFLIGYALFLICQIFVFGYFDINESHSAYGEQESGSTGLQSPMQYGNKNISIKYLIALGASHFLKSSAQMDEFSSLLELTDISSINHEEIKEKIRMTIYHLEIARDTYFKLIRLASRTPYNYQVIEKLMAFNYEDFQLEKHLLPSIYTNVESFLFRGDVTGVYNHFYIGINETLSLLYSIRRDVNVNNFPSLKKSWDTIHKFSELKLFGQYVTRVFYAIK